MNELCDRIQEKLAGEGTGLLQGDPDVREHLAACPVCFAFATSLERLDGEFARLPSLDAPDDLVARTLQRVEGESAAQAVKTEDACSSARTESQPQAPGPSWWKRPVLRYGLPAAASFVLLAVLIPNALRVYQKSESKRTMADMIAIGTATEQWQMDNAEAKPQSAPAPAAGRAAALGANGPDTPALDPDGFAFSDMPEEDAPSQGWLDLSGLTLGEDDADWTAEEPTIVTGESPVSEVEYGAPEDVRPGAYDYRGRGDRFQDQKEMEQTKGQPDALGDLNGGSFSLDEASRERDKLATRQSGALGEKKDRLMKQENRPMESRRLEPERMNELIEEQFGARTEQEENTLAPRKAARIAPKSKEKSNAAAVKIAKRFIRERKRTSRLTFKEAAGYWANTYIPGDPQIRLLEARLKGATPQVLHGAANLNLHLDAAARPYSQPFDAPENAALAVYLHSDQASIQGKTRMLVQVGLQATERRSGRRPAMNVGLVLDLRGAVDNETGQVFRALIQAFARERRVDDRFSLTVAGRAGGMIVQPGEFKYGPVSLAVSRVFAPDANTSDPGFDLQQAVEHSMRSVAGADDPSAPLGASVVIVVTSQPLGGQAATLIRMAHSSAVAGIPVSAVGVGNRVNLPELDRLALSGQGNRRFLEGASDASSLVDRELHAASRVVARAVRLRIRLSPKVKLIDVIGSRRLDDAGAERVRQAEQSIDRRVSRNLGIQADRGEDEEGIQVVIPSFYAGDSHVILLDVLASEPGSVADVTVRYKDLVWLRNGVARDNLSLASTRSLPGPLELNVLKNLVGVRLASSVRRAGLSLQAARPRHALAVLAQAQALLEGLSTEVPEWAGDKEFTNDIQMLASFRSMLQSGAAAGQGDQRYLADSLQYTAFLKMTQPLSR